MITRTVRDVLRAYRHSWWRLGAVALIVGAVMGVLLWAVSRIAVAVATHARGLLLSHGHLKTAGVNEFSIGTLAALIILSLPVVLAGIAALVRITDDTLGGSRPRVLASLAFGVRRTPRLLLGGLTAVAVLILLVILAPAISAAGLLGLLATGIVRLVGRRWPSSPLAAHRPAVGLLIRMAVPLGLAFIWLSRALLLFPSATLDPSFRLSRLWRPETGADGATEGLRGPTRVVAMVLGSLLVVVAGEMVGSYFGYLLDTSYLKVVGQSLAQMVLLGLPIVVLTILYRLYGWPGFRSGPAPTGGLPANPYGVGLEPLPAAFLAGGTSRMTPWRVRHRRVAFLLPIVLMATVVGLAGPSGADDGPPGEGGGTTAGGSITLVVNTGADDTDPTAVTTEAAFCVDAALGTGSGACTLRAALDAASNLSGGGVYGAIDVTFSSAMTIDLDATLGAIPFNNGGDNSALGVLTVESGGHSVILDGGGTTQVLNLSSHTWSFDLKGLEIRNGGATDVPANDEGGGLAINSTGISLLEGDTFDHNLAADSGGAILAFSTLRVENSTFYDNNAQQNGSAADGNDAPGGADIYEAGSGQTITANNDTFADFQGGSLYVENGSMAVSNSLFAEPGSGFDCSASIQPSDAFSDVGDVASPSDTSCPGGLAVTPPGAPTVATFGSIKSGTPPVLALKPATSGGPVNPAVGEGGQGSVLCAATDEVGQTRPASGCDAGSVEYSSATEISVASSENPSVFGDSLNFTALVTLVSGVGVPVGTVEFSVDGSAEGSPVAVDQNGNATLSLVNSTLSAGSHQVTATYTSTVPASYADSPPSSPLTQTVDASGAAVGLVSSENPAAAGDAVTFTISVTGSTLTPTGTVTLTDVTNPSLPSVVASGVTLVSGQATVTTSTLPFGNRNLVASYGGDTNNAPGHSPTLVQDIRSASSVTISPSLSSAAFGVPITFTVQVPASAGGIVPTGQVLIGYPPASGATEQFTNVTLDATGTGTLMLSTLPAEASPDQVSATYGGDPVYAASGPSSTTVTVGPASTSTAETLSPSTATVAYGVPVTVTATVSDTTLFGTADPAGSVAVMTGAGTIGTATLVGNGNGTSTATYTTTLGQLPEGTQDVSVSYVPTTNFVTSSSVATPVMISTAATNLTLSAGANPSVFGQSVQFTASASALGGSTATPTGSVTFTDGSTTLGTVALSNGTASLSTSDLSVASHSIVATLVATDPFSSPPPASLTQVVDQSPSVTGLTITPGLVTAFGTTLELEVTVAASGNGSGTPDGTVSLTDNGSSLGAITLVGGQGSTMVLSPMVSGHSVVATYLGSANFVGSTITTAYSVGPASTSSSLGASPASSVFGDPVTFTDTVTNTSPSSTVAPTGTVTFSDGVTTLGSVSLQASGPLSSVAVLTTSALPATGPPSAGRLTIVAAYDGGSAFSASTTSTLYSVDRGTTAISLQASQSIVGVPTTLTATISVTSGAGTPTGSVSFGDAQRNLGTANVSGGQAVIHGVVFGVGADTVTATYTSGDGNFMAGPPGVLVLMVTQAALPLALTVSPSGLTYGQADTETATLTAASGPSPTGTVAFTATGPGFSVSLGSAGVSAAAPYVAALAPGAVPIPVGTQQVSATYSGDANYSSTTATVEAPVITAAPTTTVVASSVNPSVVNQPITFTASVTDPTTGATPVGSVTFVLGSLSLGSVALNPQGQAQITTTPGLAATPDMTATFTPGVAPDGAPATDFTGSVDTMTQVVTLLPTLVTLTVNTQSAQLGQIVTFTAEVQPTAVASAFALNTPTGSVVVSDGNGTTCTVTLGVDLETPHAAFGSCQMSWSTSGQFTATGAYGGDQMYASGTSRSLGILVGQMTPDVSFSSNPTSWVTGEPVTFSWNISGPTLSDGTITVGFNSTTVCTSTQLTGSCTYTFDPSLQGGLTVHLLYGGDANWKSGTGSVAETVVACVPFAPPTVSPPGAGTVSVLTAPDCDGATGYVAGSPILLAETPAPNFNFQEWLRTGSTSAIDSIVAVYPGPTTDEAIFANQCVTLTLSSTDRYSGGAGITSSVAPNCGPVPHNWVYSPTGMAGSFIAGTTLTLSAVIPPKLSNGATQSFYQWTSGVPAASALTPVVSETLTGNLDVEALFGVTCFHNFSFPTPVGGTATTVGAPTCTDPSGQGYADLTQVTVSTKALGTQYFGGWTSGGVAVTKSTPNSSTGTVTITQSGITVRARYNSCVSFGVAESGEGPDGGPLGTVTVNPAGDCPTQGAGWYTVGTTVDITTAAIGNTGGIFSGWTGPPLATMASDPASYLVVNADGLETASYYYGLGCQPFSTYVFPAGAGTIATDFTRGNSCPAGMYDDLVDQLGSPTVLTLTPTQGNPLLGWTGVTTVETAGPTFSPQLYTGNLGSQFSRTFLGPTAIQGWVCEAIVPSLTLFSPDGTPHTTPLPEQGNFINTEEAPDCPLGNLDFMVGTTVHPAALADSVGYTFEGWGGDEQGLRLDPTPAAGFVLDGSQPSVTIDAQYKVNCFTLTTGTTLDGDSVADQATASPAPNCPDTPASANEYIGDTAVTVTAGHEGGQDYFSGWTGSGHDATQDDDVAQTTVVTMTDNLTVTSEFQKQSAAAAIAGGFVSLGNDIAIVAKKAVGVVAAVAGGVALGLNPVTGPVGLAVVIADLAIMALKAAGVTGSAFDAISAGVNDAAETLAFGVADLSCAAVWSANGNTDSADTGPVDANNVHNALGQTSNVAAEGIQANKALDDAAAAEGKAAAAAAEAGTATTELSTLDQVGAGLSKVKAGLSKYGSSLGTIAIVGVSIYEEAEGGPGVGWDSSASSAWTGGGDVYDSCISSSEPSYLPGATQANGSGSSVSGQ